MNLKSQQLDSDGCIILDHDQPLNSNEIFEELKFILGDRLKKTQINNSRCFEYTCFDGSKEILLCLAITYMGGNGNKTKHPPYLKRIQLQKRFKMICNFLKDKPNYNVRFIGVYHYNGNIIFTDVIKDTFLKKRMNNSSAHIYINDLIHAMEYDYFERVDTKGNKFISVSKENFEGYLNNKHSKKNNCLIDIISNFNTSFLNQQEVLAKDAIFEMYLNGDNNWKQTEWQGFYLEYKFKEFLSTHSVTNIEYIGSKKKEEVDFDLLIDSGGYKYYGDLKSSSNNTNVILGNDLNNVIHAIEYFDKLYYIIYKHDTKLSKHHEDKQTIWRNNFVKEVGELGSKTFNPLSYSSRMKHSVEYTSMYILELNDSNLNFVADIFKQGHQPSGESRNPKIKIIEKNIDNFIIYQESRKDCEI